MGEMRELAEELGVIGLPFFNLHSASGSHVQVCFAAFCLTVRSRRPVHHVLSGIATSNLSFSIWWQFFQACRHILAGLHSQPHQNQSIESRDRYHEARMSNRRRRLDRIVIWVVPGSLSNQELRDPTIYNHISRESDSLVVVSWRWSLKRSEALRSIRLISVVTTWGLGNLVAEAVGMVHSTHRRLDLYHVI